MILTNIDRFPNLQICTTHSIKIVQWRSQNRDVRGGALESGCAKGCSLLAREGRRLFQCLLWLNVSLL